VEEEEQAQALPNFHKVSFFSLTDHLKCSSSSSSPDSSLPLQPPIKLVPNSSRRVLLLLRSVPQRGLPWMLCPVPSCSHPRSSSRMFGVDSRWSCSIGWSRWFGTGIEGGGEESRGIAGENARGTHSSHDGAIGRLACSGDHSLAIVHRFDAGVGLEEGDFCSYHQNY
jgi:hypothetical protein